MYGLYPFLILAIVIFAFLGGIAIGICVGKKDDLDDDV